MKKIIIMMFVLALLIPSMVLAKEVKKGDKAMVPNWTWVDVKNPDNIASGNGSYGYGDSCGIERGGIITVIGIESTRLLVRYNIDGKKYGTPCPAGIVFFTSKEVFLKMSSDYHHAEAIERDEKASVRTLIKNY